MNGRTSGWVHPSSGGLFPASDFRKWAVLMMVWSCLVVFPTSSHGETTAIPPSPPSSAIIEVTGQGFFKNRELRRTLQLLLDQVLHEPLRASSVEDAVLVLISDMRQEGFLRPVVRADLVLVDGREMSFTWNANMDTILPRPMRVQRARFTMEPGVRYWFNSIEFVGLDSIPEEFAEEFFFTDNFLFRIKSSRVYSESGEARSRSNLQEELRLRGRADAIVRSRVLATDHDTGALDLLVEVAEGPFLRVATVKVTGITEDELLRLDLPSRTDRPFNRLVAQDLSRLVRNFFLEKGYADVRIRSQVAVSEEKAGVRDVQVELFVERGPFVTVGDIHFQGHERTRETLLNRQVRISQGEPLSLLELERSRQRLNRLGIFRSVEMDTVPVTTTPDVRDVRFDLEEGKRWEASTLLGVGSYEQLRGGLSFRQFNLFGRAHQSRAEFIQSMKSSRGDYSYTVPELFGLGMQGNARLFFLNREEISFDRQEYGVTLGLRRFLTSLGADAGLRYTFQSLESRNFDFTDMPIPNERRRVGSLDFSLSRDRRDNPLNPRSGYRMYGTIEYASSLFGGEVEFQRIEIGGSFHRSVGSGRWIHLGASHGFLMTLGGDDDLLPFNKRFFPGGDGSIRGYRLGGASPYAEDGRLLGAKTFLLLQAEYEQALLPNLSAVLFVDAVGVAARLGEYPFDDTLTSAGLGLRYESPIGPVRLEYGHNLSPRSFDPKGTFHFAIGFPF